MLKTIRNAWKLPDLRNKLLFVVFALLIFRLGILAKAGDTIPIKEKLEELHQIESIDAFILLFRIKRLLLTLQNLSIMKLMKRDE